MMENFDFRATRSASIDPKIAKDLAIILDSNNVDGQELFFDQKNCFKFELASDSKEKFIILVGYFGVPNPIYEQIDPAKRKMNFSNLMLIYRNDSKNELRLVQPTDLRKILSGINIFMRGDVDYNKYGDIIGFAVARTLELYAAYMMMFWRMNNLPEDKDLLGKLAKLSLLSGSKENYQEIKEHISKAMPRLKTLFTGWVSRKSRDLDVVFAQPNATNMIKKIIDDRSGFSSS